MKKKCFIAILYCILSFSGYSQIYGVGSGDGFAYNCIEWSQPILVPLKLLSFQATCSDNKTTLIWSAESAGSSGNYIVEKSTNGTFFYPVVNMPVKQNAGEIHHYRFIDDSVRSVKSFYRLKQTGVNGQTEYSRVISVKCDSHNPLVVDIYPNPTTGLLNIRIRQFGSSQQKNVLNIRNMFGQSVLCATIKPEVTILDIGHLPQGIYFVDIQTSLGSSHQKIVLNKN
jgi:hypothetical protein